MSINKLQNIIKQKNEIDLENIQAGILKPHGRKHACYVFLEFYVGNNGNNEIQKIKEWISSFRMKYNLTSAKGQFESSCKRMAELADGNDYNNLSDGGIVTSFHINANGFSILEIEKKNNPAIPQEQAFWNDIKLGENPLFFVKSEDIEQGYSQPFHALIILANNDKKRIHEKILKINGDLLLKGIGQVLFYEMGIKIETAGKTREHFGYQDGINNPRLLENNIPLTENCKKIVFDESHGTYLAFLKIEQNIKAFNSKVKYFANKLCIDHSYAGAQIIGRSKDGIPLSLMDHKNNITSLDSRPKLKTRCPLHAHAIKAGYNDKKEGIDEISIVRRGITYGDRKIFQDDEPNEGVGLLFTSFQKSIKGQFEENQKRFIDPHFPFKDTGIDPIMGYSKDLSAQSNIAQKWKRRNKERSKRVDFHFDFFDKDNKMDLTPIIKIKGGAYFYTPSISFLENISSL